MSYQVTEEFLKKFGLNTLDDLPELPKYKMDENRQIVIDDILKEQEKNQGNPENNPDANNEKEDREEEDN